MKSSESSEVRMAGWRRKGSAPRRYLRIYSGSCLVLRKPSEAQETPNNPSMATPHRQATCATHDDHDVAAPAVSPQAVSPEETMVSDLSLTSYVDASVNVSKLVQSDRLGVSKGASQRGASHKTKAGHILIDVLQDPTEESEGEAREGAHATQRDGPLRGGSRTFATDRVGSVAQSTQPTTLHQQGLNFFGP